MRNHKLILFSGIAVLCLFVSISIVYAGDNYIETLKELTALKTQGKITEQEFASQKKLLKQKLFVSTQEATETDESVSVASISNIPDLTQLFSQISQPSLNEIQQAVKNGSNVNSVDSSGDSVLMIAAANCNDPEIIRFLVKNGADVNAINKDFLRSVLDQADCNSNPTIKKLLLELGATNLKIEALKAKQEQAKEVSRANQSGYTNWEKRAAIRAALIAQYEKAGLSASEADRHLQSIGRDPLSESDMPDSVVDNMFNDLNSR